LNGNTSPLIIVDGLIFSGRLSDLNPADIARVDVLKDPSSKAIYGSQAANGVVLISTKMGRVAQKATITYSGNYAVSNPTVNARLLNRDEFLEKVRNIEYKNAYTQASGYKDRNRYTELTQTLTFAVCFLLHSDLKTEIFKWLYRSTGSTGVTHPEFYTCGFYI
jgi:TonB-dependent SusC/RagA subfamily outer membrane receptor